MAEGYNYGLKTYEVHFKACSVTHFVEVSCSCSYFAKSIHCMISAYKGKDLHQNAMESREQFNQIMTLAGPCISDPDT